ncbi:MAG: quinone oxidoreductase family protein, partial [Acidobacteriaceae bacterium]
GEVLVEVKAAGLHQIVRAVASGSHYSGTGTLPLVPGLDGAGRLPDGKRVYFGATRPPYGTFAERTITRAAVCVPLPDGLDDVTAAALANPGMSSRVALMRGQFVADESILILGATGVAGRLAVQVARRLGAQRVVAAGRNPAALEELAALGADVVISLNQEQDALVEAFRTAMTEAKINVVLDYLWGQPAEALLQAIARKGATQAAPRIRFVQIGSMAGERISLPAATLRSSGVELLGSGLGSASFEQIMRSVGELFQEAAKEPFQIAVKAAPLSEVEALWNSPEQGTRLVFQP